MSNHVLSTTGVSAEEALAMNQELDTWSETLPPYFQINREVSCHFKWYLFARERLWWRIWNMKIILFRHILLRNSKKDTEEEPPVEIRVVDAKCREACVDAAHATITSIHSFLDGIAPTRFVGWYAM